MKKRAAGVVVAAVATFGAGIGPALSAAIDESTFEACRFARSEAVSPSATEAKRAARQFKRLKANKAKKSLASEFADASDKKSRRAAFKRAVTWCRTQLAYRAVLLVVPSEVAVTDASTVVISGQATAGSTVSGPSGSVATDAAGNFTLPVDGVAPGRSTISIRAEAALHYPISRSVIVIQSESEGAFKASTAPIGFDELIKDPDALFGRRVYYERAKVFQYDSRTGPDALLVSVTQNQPGQFEYWTDQVSLKLDAAALGAGIDNNDIVEFWGTVIGSLSYSTAGGGTNTVPSIGVKYVNLVEKREE